MSLSLSPSVYGNVWQELTPYIKKVILTQCMIGKLERKNSETWVDSIHYPKMPDRHICRCSLLESNQANNKVLNTRALAKGEK